MKGRWVWHEGRGERWVWHEGRGGGCGMSVDEGSVDSGGR